MRRPSQMGAFLMALRVRGETVDEIAGAARIMRSKAVAIDGAAGGDRHLRHRRRCLGQLQHLDRERARRRRLRRPGRQARQPRLVVAIGLGRCADARSGSISTPISRSCRQCLWEIGIGFLMAPRHHSATRHVAPTRVELGTRTIFNLLGPLSNPAGARRQLVGVFAPEWVRPIAEVLQPARRRARLGRAWRRPRRADHRRHSTTVAALYDGKIETFDLAAEDVGLAAGASRRSEGRRSRPQCAADARPPRRRGRAVARHRAVERRRGTAGRRTRRRSRRRYRACRPIARFGCRAAGARGAGDAHQRAGRGGSDERRARRDLRRKARPGGAGARRGTRAGPARRSRRGAACRGPSPRRSNSISARAAMA